jgi:hypothetical protein
MITTALDVGIMTGIVLFVAFGLTLRRDGPHRGILRVAARQLKRCGVARAWHR